MDSQSKIPDHVAIIMDGNGRWARNRGLPKIMGHRAGVKAGEEAIDASAELGIKFLTLYTFSTENWKRPQEEVSALFGLLENYLDSNTDKLMKNNMRFLAIGRLHELPPAVKQRLGKVMDITAKNSGLTINLALNYGGRSEIVDAVRRAAGDIRTGKTDPDGIDENTFKNYLYAPDLPDPDLLIRTSGELRISNFLLWQIAYTELYITQKLWPDFTKADFKEAVLAYQSRQRRFGG